MTDATDLTRRVAAYGQQLRYEAISPEAIDRAKQLLLDFIGVALGGWLYGRIAATASGLLARCRTQGALVIYSIVVMALFSGMRSILELILVSYVVLAWVGLSHLFIKLRHAKAQ